MRRDRKYAALLIMHNAHQSWSVGCISEDGKDCEWLEGLSWNALGIHLDELRSKVVTVPARLVHGGDIMAEHTKLGE